MAKYVLSCLLLMLLWSYFGGYFVLGDQQLISDPGQNEPYRVRKFDFDWLAKVYRPMARAESLVTGMDTFAEAL